MKIVIEIGNEHYERIMRFEEDVTVYPTTLALYEAVKNGAPLPKGHGRLIDEQQIIDRFKPIEKFKHWYIGTDGLFNVLSDAPTIIEAEEVQDADSD